MRELGKKEDLSIGDDLRPLEDSITRSLDISRAFNSGKNVVCGSPGPDGEDMIHCESEQDVEAMKKRLAEGEVGELQWYVTEKPVALSL